MGGLRATWISVENERAEADHHADEGAVQLYWYNHGIPVVERVGDAESLSGINTVIRKIDTMTGLPVEERYLNGTFNVMRYDSFGRLVQITSYDSAGAVLDVVNREYRDLGRQMITWHATDPALGMGENGLPRFSDTDTTPGAYT